jgi:hypothetical protein
LKGRGVQPRRKSGINGGLQAPTILLGMLWTRLKRLREKLLSQIDITLSGQKAALFSKQA